jgi:hypothetical protein
MERIKTAEDIWLERITKKVQSIKGFYKHLSAYILVNLLLIALKYFQLDKGELFLKFSTFSTAFFWGIGLVFHAINVFGKNILFGTDWEEKKINEYMNQNQNQHTKWE